MADVKNLMRKIKDLLNTNNLRLQIQVFEMFLETFHEDLNSLDSPSCLQAPMRDAVAKIRDVFQKDASTSTPSSDVTHFSCKREFEYSAVSISTQTVSETLEATPESADVEFIPPNIPAVDLTDNDSKKPENRIKLPEWAEKELLNHSSLWSLELRTFLREKFSGVSRVRLRIPKVDGKFKTVIISRKLLNSLSQTPLEEVRFNNVSDITIKSEIEVTEPAISNYDSTFSTDIVKSETEPSQSFILSSPLISDNLEVKTETELGEEENRESLQEVQDHSCQNSKGTKRVIDDTDEESTKRIATLRSSQEPPTAGSISKDEPTLLVDPSVSNSCDTVETSATEPKLLVTSTISAKTDSDTVSTVSTQEPSPSPVSSNVGTTPIRWNAWPKWVHTELLTTRPRLWSLKLQDFIRQNVRGARSQRVRIPTPDGGMKRVRIPRVFLN